MQFSNFSLTLLLFVLFCSSAVCQVSNERPCEIDVTEEINSNLECVNESPIADVEMCYGSQVFNGVTKCIVDITNNSSVGWIVTLSWSNGTSSGGVNPGNTLRLATPGLNTMVDVTFANTSNTCTSQFYLNCL